MTDPFAIFRAECAALIRSRVREPAGYVFEVPPKKDMGQLGCNVAFQLTRLRKNHPPNIARDIVAGLDRTLFRLVRDVRVADPGFINFYLDERAYARLVLDAIAADGDRYGRGEPDDERHVVIRQTGINPTELWRLDHARGAVLGDILARLYRFAGHAVDVYASIAAADGYDDDQAALLARVHARLDTAWRLGISYDLLIWETDIVHSGLRGEALSLVRESRFVYVVQDGRRKGCLVVDLGNRLRHLTPPPRDEDDGTDQDDSHPSAVALVLSDGRPTDIGKDLVQRYWTYGLPRGDMRYAVDTVQPDGRTLWTTAPDGGPRPHIVATEIIDVIDARQIYARQVAAAALRRIGHGDLMSRHLAYGPVSVRVASEDISTGDYTETAISVDDVLDQAIGLALKQARKQQATVLEEDKLRLTAEQVAVAALRYAMIRADPLTDIVLDPAEMVEIEGNTGGRLLHAYARGAAILRQAADHGLTPEAWQGYDRDALMEQAETDLIGALGRLPDVVRLSQETLAVNLLTEYAHEVAAACDGFYDRCPSLNAVPPLPNPLLRARLGLVAAAVQVMRNLYAILGLESGE